MKKQTYIHFSCEVCGSEDLELCHKVWLPANSEWDSYKLQDAVDAGEQTEECYCQNCFGPTSYVITWKEK